MTDQPKTIPFTGELMTCVICGAQERSDPAIESQWRALDVDGAIYYACPNEFPPDDSCKDDFKTAYELVFSKIILTQARASGSNTEKFEHEWQKIYQRWQTRLVQLKTHKELTNDHQNYH